MVEVQIRTSKSGPLWPTGYYKCLFDSLCRGGAKHDPRQMYGDLASSIEQLIKEQNGRFVPRPGTLLCNHDDTEVRVIRINRVDRGEELVELVPANQSNTTLCKRFEFPFLGTIGDSKYEAQTKLNREVLKEAMQSDRTLEVLGMRFTLSRHRRDRDLDNLHDGLAPLFNRLYPAVRELLLVKEEPRTEEGEVVAVWAGTRSQVVAKVVATDL